MSAEPQRSTLLRWLKFNAVGSVGILVQLAALFLLTSGLHVNYLVATVLAVEAAVIHNFFWHERFTWADRSGADRSSKENRTGFGVSGLRFLRFNLTTGAISILGNVALMAVFAGYAHLPYVLANVTTITICSLANFLVSDRVVFQPERNL